LGESREEMRRFRSCIAISKVKKKKLLILAYFSKVPKELLYQIAFFPFHCQ
jgi:hypothetical protein